MDRGVTMNAADNHERPVQVLAGIVGEAIRSSGARALLAEVARNLIETWAGRGGIRRRLAFPAKWMIARVLKPGGNGWKISSDAGKLLTAWAKQVNAEHARNASCHSSSRGEAVHGFLKNTDFGEIREMAEGSRDCFIRTLEAFNEQLWKYPAKVGSLLGTLLALVNTGIASVVTLLKPIEEKVGPDLLADLILSLLKGIDARETARLVNAVSEFIRRLHTGNLLLAKAGRPLFQVYLTSLLEQGLPLVDPVLLRKARVAFAEDSEAFSSALSDALRDNPRFIDEMVSSYGSVKTPLIRAFSRKARLYDEVDRAFLSDAVSRGMSDLDTYEIANAFNTVVRILNGLHDIRPEVFSSFITSIVDSLDTQEMRAAASWLIPEFTEALRPILEAAVPGQKYPDLSAGGGS